MAKIISCEYLGEDECYDIEVAHPSHQFYLANGLLTSNSSHAKSYGMVTMQTAYLRTFYPVEFLAAVLAMGQTGDVQSDVDDIRRQGFKVLPVDINESKSDFRIEDNSIRLSLSVVKGVGKSAIEKILANQPYTDFKDFLYRSGATKTSILPLIKIGAFKCFNQNTAILLQQYELFQSLKGNTKKGKPAFEEAFSKVDVPDIDPVELSSWEREFLSFNISHSPFTMNGRDEKVQKFVEYGAVSSYEEFVESDDEVGRLAVVIKDWRERPQKNKQMMAFIKFGTKDGREFEVPAFSGVWNHVSKILNKGDLYIVTFNHKEEEPERLILGEPGWVHSRADCFGYFIRIDDLE